MVQPGAQGLFSFSDGSQLGFYVWQNDSAHYDDATHAFVGGLRLTGEGGLHEIDLTWSSCNFGAERPWFACPKCHRRATKMFDFGRGFECRKCANFRYRSQSRGQAWRLLDKANKRRARLGPDEEKPKGMHWRTYERLHEDIAELDMRSLDIVASRFE